MANPFARFRKNQKKWIAFLAVLCMVTFVLGYVGMELLASIFSIGARGPEMAAETKAGDLRSDELHGMVRLRNQLNRFLIQIGAQRGEEGLAVVAKFGSGELYGISPAQDMFNTWLKAQKARDMGIEVSNEEINQFLQRESENRLTRARMREILRQGQLQLTENQLFEGLRRELLARRLDDMFGMNFHQLSVLGRNRSGQLQFVPGTPHTFIPAERKAIWDKENRRVHVESLALPVEEFVGLVPDPADKQLKGLFDDYKDDLPREGSPAPGFLRPHLAQFQFFRISADRLTSAARAVVTDAEMRQRYEEEKKKAETMQNHQFRFDPDAFRREIERERKAREEEKEDEKNKAKSGKSDGSGAWLGPRSGGGALESRPARVYPVAYQPNAAGKKNSGNGSVKKEKPKEEPKGKADAKPKAVAKEAPKAKEESTDGPDLLPLNIILSTDLTIPEDILGGKNPIAKPFWQVEEEVRNMLANDHADKDLDRLRDLIKKRMDEFTTAWGNWVDQEPSPLGSAKWLAWEANEPANPLNDSSKVKKTFQDAWNTLLDEKKKAWTESFNKRKKFVEGEIKRITELDDLEKAVEELKQKAKKAKNEDWQNLLSEAEQLSDVPKAVERVAKQWGEHFRDKEPFPAPEPGESFFVWSFETTDAGSVGRGLSAQEFQKRKYAIAATRVEGDPFLQVGFQQPALYRVREATPEQGSDRFLYWTIARRRAFEPLPWSKRDSITLKGGKKITGHIQQWGKDNVVVLPKGKKNNELNRLTLERANIGSIRFAEPHDKDRRPIERDEVAKVWKLREARSHATKRARELAERIRAATKDFPVSEVGRLFKINKFTQFAPVELDDRKDWPSFEFTVKEGEDEPKYGVIVQRFSGAKRRPVIRRSEPLAAPPQTLAACQLQAEAIAAEMKDANILVLIGRLVGDAAGDEVYRGVQCVRWDSGKKKAIAWPGVVETVAAKPSGDKKPGKKPSGTFSELKPFTYADVGGEDVEKQLPFAGVRIADALFGLKPGEVSVAMNRPQDLVYVFQATDFDYVLDGKAVPDNIAIDMKTPGNPIAKNFIASQQAGALGGGEQLLQLYLDWIQALYKEYRVELNFDSVAFQAQ